MLLYSSYDLDTTHLEPYTASLEPAAAPLEPSMYLLYSSSTALLQLI